MTANLKKTNPVRKLGKSSFIRALSTGLSNGVNARDVMVSVLIIYGICSAQSVVYISPYYSTGGIGDTIIFAVELDHVYDLAGYEVRTKVDSTILYLIDATVSGTWYDSHEGYFPLYHFVDPIAGSLLVAYRRPLGKQYGLTGNGVLIYVRAEVIGTGTSMIHLNETKLGNSNIPSQPIFHEPIDGVFDNTGADLLNWGPDGKVNDDMGLLDQAHPRIAMDPSGNCYAIWQDNRDGNWDIYFSYKPAGGSWGTNVKINNDAGTAWQMYPDIAVDGSGNAYCVWQDKRDGNQDIYFSYRPAGGIWGTNVKVNDDAGTRPQMKPVIAVGSGGNAYAVWSDFRNGTASNGNWDVYSSYRPAGGVWEINTRVDDGGPTTSHWAEDPDIAIDINGGAHVVWRYTAASHSLGGEVHYSYRESPASSWTSIPVTPAGDPLNYYPAISVDGSRNLYCVWQRYVSGPLPGAYDIMFSYRQKAGGPNWDDWTAPVKIDDASNPSYQTSVAISAGADGNAYAIWADRRNGDWDIYSSYRPSGGVWQMNERINHDPGTAGQWYPSVVAGSAWAVWQDFRDNNWDIYCSAEGGADVVPPMKPYITKAEKISNSDVQFYWYKVITDTLGNSENINYYVVYRNILPDFIPGPLDSIGSVVHPDTSFTDVGVLNLSQDYYYLVKAVDETDNRSRKSNMGYKFNKFFNENASATDKNWVSLPYHSGYTTVSNLTTDLSSSGNPLEKITNLRDDQNCESWLWDPDFLEWGGANFAIESGRGYEMVTIKDTTLVLVGANSPDGLIALNENPSATDKNWVSIPYNAVYSTVSDITTEYSPAGNPLEKITNLRDDQNCESWIWDPDFFEWGGANFAIETGRAYEFVTIIDTTWNPTEYTNEAKQMGPHTISLPFTSRPEIRYRGMGGTKGGVRKLDIEIYTGKLTEPERGPVWFTPTDNNPRRMSTIQRGKHSVNQHNSEAMRLVSSELPNLSTSSYRDVGTSHIVRCHLSVKGFEGLIFTAYRPCKPKDALTENMIGSCIMKNGSRAALWFDVANFKNPWQPGEEVILIIEAVKQGRGYFAAVNFLLDNSVDIQELSDISLAPISWNGIDDDNIVGYSVYRGDKRLNKEVITKNEYLIEGDVVLKPVLKGGYETVYGSGQQGEENALRSTLDATRFLEVYPNPFSEKIDIRYSPAPPCGARPGILDTRCWKGEGKQNISESVGRVSGNQQSVIKVFDVAGRLVRQWDYKTIGQSNYVVWDATDDIGRRVSPGVYFIQMKSDDYQSQHKVIFVH